MGQRREKEPFIRKGDRIRIAGTPLGSWDVLDARWADAKPEDERIRLVLGRGSTRFPVVFDPARMQHESLAPGNILSRDIIVNRPVRVRKPGIGGS
jgi:hypothetical protein